MQTFACQNLLVLTGRRYLTSYPDAIDRKLSSDINMIFAQNS